MRLRCPPLSICALGAALAVASWSCSPSARQRLADFFFEIPSSQPTSAPADLQPSQMSMPTGASVAAGTPFASVHEPVARRRCSACHDANAEQTLVKPWTEKCVSCHQPVVRKPFLHGPVGAMACNECHLPHASALPSLLRQPDPALCMSCHATTLRPDPPYHADATRGCATCHDPHGGDNRNLLKPRRVWDHDAPTTTAASGPADGDER